jgi:hypothetical protein
VGWCEALFSEPLGEHWNLGMWGWACQRRRRQGGGAGALRGDARGSGGPAEADIGEGGAVRRSWENCKPQVVRPVVEARAERASSLSIAILFSGGAATLLFSGYGWWHFFFRRQLDSYSASVDRVWDPQSCIRWERIT